MVASIFATQQPSMRPPSGGPTLNTLTLSGPIAVGAPSSGTIIGRTATSTISSGLTGLTVNSAAATYIWDGTGPFGSNATALTETLAGATNNPKNSPLFVSRTEANTYIAALPSSPDSSRRVLIQQLFQNLLVGTVNGTNVFSKLDYLHRYACEDGGNALIDMVQVIPYTASPINNPVFTVDRQFATDGVSSYVDTGYNPLTAARWTVGSACFGIWCRDNVARDPSAAGFLNGSLVGTLIAPWQVTNNTIAIRANEATGGATAPGSVSTSVGHTAVNRADATSSGLQIWRNGALIPSTSAAATAIANGNLRCGSVDNTRFQQRSFAFSHGGPSLTPNEMADLYAAFAAYMTAIGA